MDAHSEMALRETEEVDREQNGWTGKRTSSMIKYGLIVVLVIYILYWTTTSGPSNLADLVKKAATYATVFGGIWLLCAALVALAGPTIGSLFNRLLNRGNNSMKQKARADKMAEALDGKGKASDAEAVKEAMKDPAMENLKDDATDAEVTEAINKAVENAPKIEPESVPVGE